MEGDILFAVIASKIHPLHLHPVVIGSFARKYKKCWILFFLDQSVTNTVRVVPIFIEKIPKKIGKTDTLCVITWSEDM